MHLWLITQVEDEDLLERNRGETRGKKTRTLEDEKEEPLDTELRPAKGPISAAETRSGRRLGASVKPGAS